MTKPIPVTSCSYDPDLDDLERLSNSVVDLIEQGRLDDAERTCLELQRRYPDMIDWIERTGAVHEARGEVGQAIAQYRQCIDYIDSHPDDFDTAARDWYRSEIDRLESYRRR